MVPRGWTLDLGPANATSLNQGQSHDDIFCRLLGGEKFVVTQKSGRLLAVGGGGEESIVYIERRNNSLGTSGSKVGGMSMSPIQELSNEVGW